MQPTIFISVAAFCDPVLSYTLSRAVAQARYPAQLHFGVVNQNLMSDPQPEESWVAPAKISVVHVYPVHSKGACWARSLAMSLYNNEDYFFQIDSHMDFEKDWDVTMIEQSKKVALTSPNHVITSYPHAFKLENNVPSYTKTTENILYHVVKKNSQFSANSLALRFDAVPVNETQAVTGFHVGAGCLFAPGSYVQKFPYDPYLYFHGEEQAIAIRLFTHGWDIFHMPKLPIFHMYNSTPGAVGARKLHWDQSFESFRPQRWTTLENNSQQRIIKLVSGCNSLGVYGIGNLRSVGEYAEFSGIDYLNRVILPKAYTTVYK